MKKYFTITLNFISSIYLLMIFLNFDAIETFAQNTPHALLSFTTNSTYNPYVHLAVNNAHFITTDETGNIFIAFLDSAKNLVVKTYSSGVWYSQTVVNSIPNIGYKNPCIEWRQGSLHLSWFELASGNATIKYAKGLPLGIGTFSWSISTFASIPINGPKYLTMAVPDTSFSPQIGFTEANDTRARMFSLTGESPISPMNSGLGTWENSSDLTIAADSNIVIVAWEEAWTGPQPKDKLVFSISYNGGLTWEPTQNLLNTGPTLGGDPCLAIVDRSIYVVFQKPVIGNSSDIIAARMLPGMNQFELMNLNTPELGKIGKGWLPNIDIDEAHPDRIVVSWERTDGEYFNKWEHRVAVAYILNADQTPTLLLGPETTSLPTDTSLYDLNSNIIISPDGETVSFVWVNLKEFSETNILLTLYFQQEVIPIPSGIKESANSSPVMMYPNPVVGALRFTKPQEGIRIYNIQGELMMEINEATSIISIDNFPMGIYFIKTKTSFGKFIKAN